MPATGYYKHHKGYYYLTGYNLEDWANNHNYYHHHYHGRAVAQRLVTALSLRKTRFISRAVRIKFVVDEVEL
jgi:hypothetical protein